jgi:hypothetical protein
VASWDEGSQPVGGRATHDAGLTKVDFGGASEHDEDYADGLTLPRGSGAVEGSVNKLKARKRPDNLFRADHSLGDDQVTIGILNNARLS